MLISSNQTKKGAIVCDSVTSATPWKSSYEMVGSWQAQRDGASSTTLSYDVHTIFTPVGSLKLHLPISGGLARS